MNKTLLLGKIVSVFFRFFFGAEIKNKNIEIFICWIEAAGVWEKLETDFLLTKYQ